MGLFDSILGSVEKVVMNSAKNLTTINSNTVRNTINRTVTGVENLIPSAIRGIPIVQQTLNTINGSINNSYVKNLSQTLNKIPNVGNVGNLISFASGLFGTQTNAFGSTPTVTLFQCGYRGDVGRNVPEAQLITISAFSEQSSAFGTITGTLQDKFSLNVTSNWESFIPAIASIWDTLSQATIGESFYNPITSRRIWKGTSPLKLTVELYFISITDTQIEVINPCLVLQRMCLPSIGTDIPLPNLPFLNGNSLRLLNPPGPSPFHIDQNGNQTDGKGDQITIDIGGIFKFNSVILKDVTVEYDNKMDVNGLPISAKARIEFETYEILTKERMNSVTYPFPSSTIDGSTMPTPGESSIESSTSIPNTVTSVLTG